MKAMKIRANKRISDRPQVYLMNRVQTSLLAKTLHTELQMLKKENDLLKSEIESLKDAANDLAVDLIHAKLKAIGEEEIFDSVGIGNNYKLVKMN